MREPSRCFSPRFRASGVHALLSLCCALAVAVLVLVVWYPQPYGELSGGTALFWLVVTVDMVMGPLLTLVVFNIKKPRGELVRDLAIIVVLQLGALTYGLHTVFIARPVALVFEADRFRVVTANQVLEEELTKALPQFRRLSLTGPRLLGIRKSRGDETLRAVDLALQGYDTGQRPTYWVPYNPESAVPKANSIGKLINRYPQSQADIEARVKALTLNTETALYVPVLSRAEGWVAILDAKGNPRGFMPYDGF